MPEKICHECKNPYTTLNTIDDGYCSFSCWESANCKTPQIKFEKESVEEILSFKS